MVSDERRVLAAAGVRAFCVGLTGVLLGIYLARLGLGPASVGMVIGAGLAGNAAATAMLARPGSALDRRTILLGSTLLSTLGLGGMAALSAPPWLVGIAFVGLVNGMGRDRGPAQIAEHSLLVDAAPPGASARIMARYAALQDVTAGLGSLAAGLPELVMRDPVTASRMLLAAAALLQLAALLAYRRIGPALASNVAPPPPTAAVRRRIRGLTGLFALDSLGGGFLAASILSYWFFTRFGLTGEVLGPLFLTARALNAASYFGAALLANRIGLLHTMVFTHLPSSIFLLLLPLAATPLIAVGLFLAREALVQMDVPARQAYVGAVTGPGERTYAFAITGLARNVGWAVGPGLAGWSVEILGLGAPLVIGAGLKVAYDLLLFRSSRGRG